MTITAHLGIVSGAIKAAEAVWPKPVAQALADRDRLATAAANLPPVTYGDLHAAMAAALLDNRDPFTDDKVRRLVTGFAIIGESSRGVTYGVQQVAEARIVDALTEHADKILQAFKVAVDTAGEVLREAYTVLGDVDLYQADVILKRGAKAAAAWTNINNAQGLIRTIE